MSKASPAPFLSAHRYILLAAELVLTFTCAQALGGAAHSNADSSTSLEIQGSSSKFLVDVVGVDAHDQSVNHVVRAAFRHLAEVWTSPVPVLCRLAFTDLGAPESLASGGGVLFVHFDRSPDRELMPIAAAEAMTGRNLNDLEQGHDRYDVLIKMNNRTSWHTKLDSGPLEDEYDLFTVILHETYHNLLFSGAVAVNEGRQRQATAHGMVRDAPSAHLLDGYPARFDLFLANEDGCSVLDYQRDARLANATGRTAQQLLAQAVSNDRLFFHDRTSGFHIPLYAPLRYQSKSSIYHIDTSRGGTAGVMNRFIPSGFMQREINAEILGIQNAVLNPNNRGAKRCKFPLSDPAPERTVSADFMGDGASLSTAPIWLVVSSCVATVTLSMVVFLFCSTFIPQDNDHPAIRCASRRWWKTKYEEQSAASSSGNLLIDRGFACESDRIDVRDLEIDDEEFDMFEYDLDGRSSQSTVDREI